MAEGNEKEHGYDLWRFIHLVSCWVWLQSVTFPLQIMGTRMNKCCFKLNDKILCLIRPKIGKNISRFFFTSSQAINFRRKSCAFYFNYNFFILLQEPLCLSKCVVSQGENEFQEYIEINEITTKNTYFIQVSK